MSRRRDADGTEINPRQQIHFQIIYFVNRQVLVVLVNSDWVALEGHRRFDEVAAMRVERLIELGNPFGLLPQVWR